MPDIQVCVSRNDWHFQLLFFILITWATQSTSPNFNYCIRSPLSKCWGEAVEEINCCTYIFFCRHCGSCFLTVLLCHPPQVVALVKPDVRPAENKHIHATVCARARVLEGVQESTGRGVVGWLTPSIWMIPQCLKPGSPGSAGRSWTGEPGGAKPL